MLRAFREGLKASKHGAVGFHVGLGSNPGALIFHFFWGGGSLS